MFDFFNASSSCLHFNVRVGIVLRFQRSLLCISVAGTAAKKNFVFLSFFKSAYYFFFFKKILSCYFLKDKCLFLCTIAYFLSTTCT